MKEWSVYLTERATQDIDNIIDWTLKHFGQQQMRTYANLIGNGLTKLAQGPESLGVHKRPELGKNIATLHLGQKGRHLFVFSIDYSEFHIQVLRVLHDTMDTIRHLETT